MILVSLPLLLPIMLAIALLIRVVSAGPVLFRQERVGHLGGRFLCFKFRTMRVGNHAALHQGHLNRLLDSNLPMKKMDDHGDPRIIPFGLPLRSSGLDELPQIINVLRGDMSLVGPRPCVPYEYEKYTPAQRERFNALPGLTGLWQVSGKNKTTFEEMIQFDIAYARNQTPWLDCKIIFKTIPALVTQVRETRRERKLLAGAAPGGAAPALAREPEVVFRRQPLAGPCAGIGRNKNSGENMNRSNKSRSGGLRLLGAEPGKKLPGTGRLQPQDDVRCQRNAPQASAVASTRRWKGRRIISTC